MDIFGLETKPAEPICEELERQLENLLALRKKLRRKAVIRISLIIYAAYISLFAAAAIVLVKNGAKAGFLGGIGGGLAVLVQAAIDALADRAPSMKKLNEEIEAVNRQLYPEAFQGLKAQKMAFSPATKRAWTVGLIIGIVWLAVAFLAGIPLCIAYGSAGTIFILGGLALACYGFSVAFTKSFKPGVKAVLLPGALLVLPIAISHFFFKNSDDIAFPAGLVAGIVLFTVALLALTHTQRKARIFLRLNHKKYWAVPSQREGIAAEVYNKKGDRALISVYVDSRHAVLVEKKIEGGFQPVGQNRQFFLYISALYHAARELLRLYEVDDGRPEDGFAHRYDAIKEVAESVSRFSFLEGKVEAKEDYESLTIAFHRCLTMEVEEGAVLINGALFLLNWDKDMVMDLVSKLLSEEIILFEYRRKKIFFPRQAFDFLLSKYSGKNCRIYSGINIYSEREKKQ